MFCSIPLQVSSAPMVMTIVMAMVMSMALMDLMVVTGFVRRGALIIRWLYVRRVSRVAVLVSQYHLSHVQTKRYKSFRMVYCWGVI